MGIEYHHFININNGGIYNISSFLIKIQLHYICIFCLNKLLQKYLKYW